MGKNVAVFVDVANIFYAAKAAGVDIDYVTLLKSATAGRDFVRAYAYTGLDPDNENQRNFHAFLARNHYKVVSKDIRKYGDGKVKANLDIELVVDLMKTARNLDVAIVVSGDGDFAPAIRAVQEMGVRVEVISFRGNTSSDLIEVADLFTDITQLARVEKGSSRSGRRVASDGEEDLSMTEVPDKQTEGTGPSRGRGRGRGRGRAAEAEPATAPVAARSASRNGSRGAAAAAAAGLTVLPGEKLSRAGAGEDVESIDVIEDEDIDATPFDAGEEGEDSADGRRRRRRRGGRGRGRGRGRDQEPGAVPDAERVASSPEDLLDEDEDEDEDADAEVDVAAARAPRPTPFGSVWDSQLGVATSRPSPLPPPVGDDEEDFDEPEIPEYLIAEQRRGQANRGGNRPGQGGRGGRGGARGSYNAAIERERYGRGGGGGINRYPDVGDRGNRAGSGSGGGGGRQQSGYGRGDRGPRQERPERAPVQRSSSSEPWSEVPEELEAMLRAQLAQSPKAASRPSAEAAPVREESQAVETAEVESTAPKRRTRKTAATASSVTADAPEAEAAAPKRKATTRRKTASTADVEAGPSDVAATAADSAVTADAAPAKRTRTTKATGTTATKKSTSSRSKAAAADGDAEPATADAAPKRRTTRKKAEPA